MEALPGDHLDIFLRNVSRLLHRLLSGHEVLLLIVHGMVAVGTHLHTLHRRRSDVVVLYYFLDVHCRLGSVLLLLWEHKVVLGSELGGHARLGIQKLLLLFDDFAFGIF